jgi:hypothetical protein
MSRLLIPHYAYIIHNYRSELFYLFIVLWSTRNSLGESKVASLGTHK